MGEQNRLGVEVLREVGAYPLEDGVEGVAALEDSRDWCSNAAGQHVACLEAGLLQDRAGRRVPAARHLVAAEGSSLLPWLPCHQQRLRTSHRIFLDWVHV